MIMNKKRYINGVIGGEKVTLFAVQTNKNKDFFITICVAFLCLFGMLFVYSASNYNAFVLYNDSYYFLKKQIIGYIIGGIAYAFMSHINYRVLKKYALSFYIVCAILLALVLTPLGLEVYGAKRWLGIGGFSIQPSDLAKFALVLFIATYFSSDMLRATTVKGCLPMIVAGGVYCLLIIAEPNMSITVCVGLIMLVMLFAAGMQLKHLAMLMLPIIAALPILIIIEPYRLNRLYAFLDPWSSPKGEGYQLLQSLYALGNGGLFGVGIFNSRQKLRFLPFAESDFILSVIGEELGFVGILILLAICIFLTSRIIRAGKKSGNFFAYLLCVGVSATFIVQIAVNALVVTGSIPPTGVPFPLISSGNTQIIVYLASFGLVHGISAE